MPTKEYIAADPERHQEMLKRNRERWAAMTPEERRDEKLRQRYGLEPGSFDRMMEAQGGVCALCQQPPSGKLTALYVDHCHETGEVRGLLCLGCNRSLGRLGDSEAGILRVLEYLRRPTPFDAWPC